MERFETKGITMKAIIVTLALIGSMAHAEAPTKVYVIGSAPKGTASKVKAKRALVKSDNNETVYECRRRILNERKATLQYKGSKKIYVIGSVPKGTESKFQAERALILDSNATVYECNQKYIDEDKGSMKNI